MKRIIRTILIAALVAATALCAVACSAGNGKDGAKGLLVKKFAGDDFYTVYGYVSDGTDTLDIGAYAKDNGNITIGRIKDGAFKDNDNLKTVIVPATVTEIDAGAFKNMRALENLTLPFVGIHGNGDAYIGQTEKGEDKDVDVERTFAAVFGTEEYEGGASVTANYGSSTATYYIPATLAEVTIAPAADKACNIPAYAFNGISGVSTVNVGEGVVAIGAYAFASSGVEKVTLATTVEIIYAHAFDGASKIKDGGISFDGLSLKEICEHAFEKTNLSKLSVKAERICEYAFAGSALEEVTLSGVKEIGAYAFASCEELEKINIKSAQADVVLGVKALGDAEAVWNA